MRVRSPRKFRVASRPRIESLEPRVYLSGFAFGPITTFPGQLPLPAVAATVTNQSGFATVPIVRTGHGKELSSTQQVQVIMSGGTAQPGVDYAPTNETLTFKPHETEQAVIVPLLNSGKASGQETVSMTLTSQSGATSGAVLQSAVLTIPNQSSAGPPVVERVSPIIQHNQIVQLQVTFDKPMNVSSVENTSNYWSQVENVDDMVGNTDNTSSFQSAVYDASTQTVTLTPEKPLKTGLLYNLWSPANLFPGAGILDTDGDALAAAAIEFGAGRTLKYAGSPEGCMCSSNYWHEVTTSLSGPGTMIVDNALLFLIGTEPKQSVLTGVNSPPYAFSWTIVSPDGAVDRTHGAGM